MPIVASWLVAVLVVGAVAVALYFVYATCRIAAHAEKAVPPSGKFIVIAGNRIHYVEAGEGRPIVFIHGLGAQLHHFRHPLFARLAGSYGLVALDRPGSGYSVRAPGGGAGLSEQARIIVEFIRTLGLEKPLLVGHSLGGMLALTIAIEHPGVASGLALLAPLTRYSGKVAPEFAALHIAAPWKRWLVSRTTAVPKALKQAAATLDFVFGPQPAPADYAVEGGGYLGLRPGHFYAASSDLVGLGKDMKRLAERYGEIGIPVGILFGTEDRVLSHKAHGLAMQNKLAGLDLELLDGIGHMPQFVATDRVEAFVRRMAAKAFGGSE